MRIYIFYIVALVFVDNAWADCDDARRKCRSECSSMISVNGNYIDSHNTDFQSNCEDACKKGLNECEDASRSLADRCYDFKSKCKRSCPSSIYVYSESDGVKSGYSYDSNANSVCEDACSAGYRRCE